MVGEGYKKEEKISRNHLEPRAAKIPLYNKTTPNKPKFTGYERDEATGFDYMHFRYYVSNIGRFMKPDNVNRSFLNPQNWNLNSYVRGNHVNFNNPTGHDLKGKQGKRGMSFALVSVQNVDISGMLTEVEFYESFGRFAQIVSGIPFAAEYYLSNFLSEKKETEKIGTKTNSEIWTNLCGFPSIVADIGEIGKLLLEGGVVYGQVTMIQLAKDMMALIRGLLSEGVGKYSILSKELAAWNRVYLAATEGTPFNVDKKVRDIIQDSAYEIYNISQVEGVPFKELWKEYGMPYGGSGDGKMAVGFLEWYKKRFI